MRVLVLVFVLATLVSSSHAGFKGKNPFKMMGRRVHANPIKMMGQRVGANYTNINCQSFGLGVEANNLRDWDGIPSNCKDYIESYFDDEQYEQDLEAVVIVVYEYLEAVDMAKKNDIWRFDIEETLLSNYGYLSSPEVNYGVNSIDRDSYYAWLDDSNGVEIKAVYDIYFEVMSWDYPIYLISEAPESFRQKMVNLLDYAGYKHYEKIILMGENDNGKTVSQYKADKRKELEEKGYKIVGNVGDQWTDLTGEHAGQRTFKIPNPVYYVK